MCKSTTAIPEVVSKLSSHIAELSQKAPLSDDTVDIVITTIINACETIKAKVKKRNYSAKQLEEEAAASDATDGILSAINTIREKYKANKKNIELYINLLISLATTILEICLT